MSVFAVATVLNVMFGIRYFLAILFFVMCGFSVAFWIVATKRRQNSHGSARQTFFSTFLNMLGQNIQVEEFNEDTIAPQFSSVLLVLFLLFMMVLMLNLLITIIQDTFNSSKPEREAIFRRERSSVLLEMIGFCDYTTRLKNHRNRYIHVLKYKFTPLDKIDDALSPDEIAENEKLSKSLLELVVERDKDKNKSKAEQEEKAAKEDRAKAKES